MMADIDINILTLCIMQVVKEGVIIPGQKAICGKELIRIQIIILCFLHMHDMLGHVLGLSNKNLDKLQTYTYYSLYLNPVTKVHFHLSQHICSLN